MGIYKQAKKITLYRGAYYPAELYKGDKKIEGYDEKTFKGQKLQIDKTYNETSVNIKINGGYIPCKNLFDITALSDAGFTTILNKETGEFIFDKVSGVGSFIIPVICKPNTQYTVSLYFSAVKEQSAIIGFVYSDGTYSNINCNGNPGQYVFSSGISLPQKTIEGIVFGGSGGLASGSVFKCVQLEEGTNCTDYSAHIPPVWPTLKWNDIEIIVPHILSENNYIFSDTETVSLCKYNGKDFDITDISQTEFGAELLSLKTAPESTSASISEGSLEITVLIQE